MNWINSIPQAAVTTFAFSSAFILILLVWHSLPGGVAGVCPEGGHHAGHADRGGGRGHVVHHLLQLRSRLLVRGQAHHGRQVYTKNSTIAR